MIQKMLEEKFYEFNQLTEDEKSQIPHVNCCEHILTTGNDFLKMGLSKEYLAVAKGFGGGMKIESTCGALTGAIMFLSLSIKDEEKLDNVIQDFFEKFKKTYGPAMDCKPLKDAYRHEKRGCQPVILMAADILDSVLKEDRKQVTNV
jgi:C_GCAxxG_C_C family probable redox protein